MNLTISPIAESISVGLRCKLGSPTLLFFISMSEHPNSSLSMAPVMVLVNCAEPRSGLLIRVSSMRSTSEEPVWLLVASVWVSELPPPLALCEYIPVLFTSSLLLPAREHTVATGGAQMVVR